MAKTALRIIAGQRRGWRLESPRGRETTRPITNRVKENLFNIIQGRVPGAMVLDLFAGTGSMALEALSRGADWATFVEHNREVAAILRRNVARLGYEMQSRIVTGDALRPRAGLRDTGLRDRPEALQFDLVFVDPPYAMMADELLRERVGEALGRLIDFDALAADTMFVVRREARAPEPRDWPHVHLDRTRRYGTMCLDFLRPENQGAANP